MKNVDDDNNDHDDDERFVLGDDFDDCVDFDSESHDIKNYCKIRIHCHFMGK